MLFGSGRENDDSSQYKEIIEWLHLLWSHPLAGPLREDFLPRFQRRGAAAAAAAADKQEKQAKALSADDDKKGRPLVHVRTIGRRKASTAQVTVTSCSAAAAAAAAATAGDAPAAAAVTINRVALNEYFPRAQDRLEVLAPLRLLGVLGDYSIKATVRGGGHTGQAGAIRLAVSRAMETFDSAARLSLRQAGYLTRDARVVERKKPGQKKARKKFQWVKR